MFEASGEMGDITGLYMLDEEGTITTVDVQAKFVNGKPDRSLMINSVIASLFSKYILSFSI